MKMKSNALIAQAGGPTAVINASLSGIVSRATEEKNINRVYGCRFGMYGLLNEQFADLSRETPQTIRDLKNCPGSALGSSRHKLSAQDMPRVLEILKKHEIRYFFGIGGNDTMLNVFQIEDFCRKNQYELFGMGCPKTVDNDLFGTDHTPGFPSAARFVALSVLQAGVLARDMQKVDQFSIYQSIGRDSGWLAAAAFAAKKEEADPPHILLLPEVPFDPETFFKRFSDCQQKYGFVSIVCGEGIAHADGRPVSASHVKDNFANIEFGAMGGTSAAVILHRMLCDQFKFRGEFQIPESLAMCAADRAVSHDIEEAFRLGQSAVQKAANGISGLMTTLVRQSGRSYAVEIGTFPLNEVAAKTKPIPKEWIMERDLTVNEKFGEYIRPLIGSLPEYAKLGYYSVAH